MRLLEFLGCSGKHLWALLGGSLEQMWQLTLLQCQFHALARAQGPAGGRILYAVYTTH